MNLWVETTYDEKIKNADPSAAGITFVWDIIDIVAVDGTAIDDETKFEYILMAKQGIILIK